MELVEIDREEFEIMVSDYMADHAGDPDWAEDPICLDGEPYYDEDLASWTQDAQTEKHAFQLLPYGGEIFLLYAGRK